MFFDPNGVIINEKEVTEKELQSVVETKILRSMGIHFLSIRVYDEK